MPFYLLSAHFSDESYNSSEVLSIYSHFLPSIESSLTMLSLPLPSWRPVLAIPTWPPGAKPIVKDTPSIFALYVDDFFLHMPFSGLLGCLVSWMSSWLLLLLGSFTMAHLSLGFPQAPLPRLVNDYTHPHHFKHQVDTDGAHVSTPVFCLEYSLSKPTWLTLSGRPAWTTLYTCV